MPTKEEVQPDSHYAPIKTRAKEHTPLLALSTAMHAWFLLPDGCIRQVGTCSAVDFLCYTHVCMQSANSRYVSSDVAEFKRAATLDDLERWYIIELLYHYQTDIALFASLDALCESL